MTDHATIAIAIKHLEAAVRLLERAMSGYTPPPPKPDPVPSGAYEDIIGHLNKETGGNFRHSAKAHRDLIRARWEELGDDASAVVFKKVIDKMVRRAREDKFKEEWLRPGTLFRASKFPQYMGLPDANESPGYRRLEE